uniref:Nucleolar 27S pre-rRNA processing Urb2/Npa2 C-terminal domain-containing protein n=1 Tax=Kwoniella bestiolae CBS 10118 TaxID=1296100 RepID=A0A1B9GF66_9TREE|nr:hypothetical protein I302_01209 [Kwoniella bestiolae CBS 10118]OCF29697.1 hypothetical protein I302_01209 [Kwoniella bestiolae CBS 10118]
MPAYLASASGLIKALKGASDPPQPDAPPKIDIALTAWKQDSFHVPRKAEVLRDWVIESWSRTHKKASPISEPKYHQLLLDTTPHCDTPAQAPLSIISSFFQSLPESQDHITLLDLASRSFASIYPPQQLSHKPEAWTDVYTSILHPLSLISPCPQLTPLIELITSRVTEALPSAPNGKKLSTTAAGSFPSFCKAISTHPSLTPALTHTFSLLLFQVPLLSTTDPLQPILSHLPTQNSHTALPLLFSNLVETYHQHRYSIFTQASSSIVAHDVFVATKEREAVRLALERILVKVEGDYSTRSSLWKTIESWGGYMEREPAWSQMMHSEARITEDALSSDPSLLGTLLDTLATLERLDHDQAKLSSNVVRWCLACPVSHRATASTVISSLLRFHQLTHSLPTFFSLLLDSLEGLFTPDLPEDIVTSLYKLTVDGPLTARTLRQDIIQSLRSICVGKGRTNVWNEILGSVVSRLTPLVNSQPTGKKRKRSWAPTTHAAALIGIHTRLICYCLLAASSTTHDVDATNASIPALSELIAGWANDNTDTFAGAVSEAGRLRTARSVEKLLSSQSDTPTPILQTQAVPELSIEMTRFIFHCAAFTQSINPKSVDALLDILQDISSPLWQIAINQGMPLLDSLATPTQLQRLAMLIAKRTTQPTPAILWDLPNIKDAVQSQITASPPDYLLLNACPPSYLDRKVKLHAVEATQDISLGGKWLDRLASEHDSSGLMSRDTKLLQRVVTIAATGNPSALSLLGKLVSSMIVNSPRNSSPLLCKRRSKSTSRRRRTVLTFLSYASTLPQMLDLYAITTLASPSIDDLDAIDNRNVLCKAGRWLGAEGEPRSTTSPLTLEAHQTEPLGPRLCAALMNASKSSNQSRLAQLTLETFATETNDIQKIIAAAIVVYSAAPGLTLDSTVQTILAGQIPEAIACCASIPASAPCLEILAALCMRCNDPTALREAVHAALSSTSDHSVIGFFEKITEDKASALQHDDVTRLLSVITESLSPLTLLSSINVITALARRRPDLILANLPEVVDVLAIMFSTRPIDALPLSRLLVALTQMRLKTHEISPLAKHIPAILVAYVRAAADLHLGVRRELEPGLYALCNLVTSGGRAHARGREGEGLGIPFGLGEGSGGEGERELWADLWQSWNKSRYMGQG